LELGERGGIYVEEKVEDERKVRHGLLAGLRLCSGEFLCTKFVNCLSL